MSTKPGELHTDFSVDELRLSGCEYGLQVQANVAVGSLVITGGPAVAVQVGAGIAFSVDGATTLDAGGTGVFGVVGMANSAIDLSGGAATITGYDYGLGCFGDVAVVGGNLDFAECGTGIYCTSGTVTYAGSSLTIDGDGFGVGIALNAASFDCTSGTIQIEGVDKGVTCTGAASIAGEITIASPIVSGVSVINSSGSVVSGVTVLSPAQDGICAGPGAVVILDGIDVVGSSGTGVGAYSGSHAALRNSELRFCSTAIYVDGSSTVDAGNLMSVNEPGNNVFYNSSGYDLINLNQSETAAADGNTWYYKGVAMCPPNANRIIGLISTICP